MSGKRLDVEIRGGLATCLDLNGTSDTFGDQTQTRCSHVIKAASNVVCVSVCVYTGHRVQEPHMSTNQHVTKDRPE